MKKVSGGTSTVCIFSGSKAIAEYDNGAAVGSPTREYIYSGGATASYVYNAEGQRVRKSTAAGSVDYLYDLAGHEITEVSSSGGWNRGEVYAGGRHLATYANNTTYFIHPDWLGTERTRSDKSGAPFETCTSLPFGDWLTCSGGDVSPMHFTGKERDAESGLDDFDARYFGSSMGRFMSPDDTDPEEHVGDPQGLNLYSYVRNNPTNATDPDGHDCVYINHNSASVVRGDCKSDTDNGVYVNGTVDTNSLTYKPQTNELGYSFSNEEEQTGGAGTISLGPQQNQNNSNPGQLNPFAQGVFTQLNQMNILNNTLKIYGASALIGITGGAACYYLCPEAGITTLGLEGAGEATAGSEEVGLTEHAAQRLAQRGISKTQVQDAIRTAREAGRVTTKLGKYGTPQEIYKGSNGITVVLETVGRNAGKVITAFFH